MRRFGPAAAVLGPGAAILIAALWWGRHPSACPYSQRFWVEAPHPLITRRRLLETLSPASGERLLEVGPGTGYYSLSVAERLGEGTLHVCDIQQQMLDHVARAAARGITNVEARFADATALPYEDDSFDGAYLVAVLGEVRDRPAALRELRRVVRGGGRVVVGEIFGDPHMVGLARLEREAAGAGLALERRVGSRLGFFARLR